MRINVLCTIGGDMWVYVLCLQVDPSNQMYRYAVVTLATIRMLTPGRVLSHTEGQAYMCTVADKSIVHCKCPLDCQPGATEYALHACRGW